MSPEDIRKNEKSFLMVKYWMGRPYPQYVRLNLIQKQNLEIKNSNFEKKYDNFSYEKYWMGRPCPQYICVN